MAHCRICKAEIDKEKDDWIRPVRNYYYHKKCYRDWKNANHINDDEYVDLIYDFIARDLKVSYNWHVCEAQRKKFIKEKMTNKGILFALKYFYEVKHGNWEKGHGGIGIVPFVYNDSCAYWAARERSSQGTIAEIEHQMRAAANRESISIKRKESKTKYQVDFSILDDLEDEE